MAETAPLEDRLEELLDQETFSPPDEFQENAAVTDESVYEQADDDFEAFWAEQAKALQWQEDYDQVLDWSDPPFAKWFVGGKLTSPRTASTATSRTATAIGSRSTGAVRRRGGGHHLCRPPSRRPEVRQRAEGRRGREGRRRRDLPADGARGRRRDARVRAHRRAAQRRLRRVLP